MSGSCTDPRPLAGLVVLGLLASGCPAVVHEPGVPGPGGGGDPLSALHIASPAAGSGLYGGRVVVEVRAEPAGAVAGVVLAADGRETEVDATGRASVELVPAPGGRAREVELVARSRDRRVESAKVTVRVESRVAWQLTLGGSGPIHALAADGDVLAVSSDAGVHLVDLSRRAPRCAVATRSEDLVAPVKAPVTFDGDGRLFLTRAAQRCLAAVDVATCELRWDLDGSGYADCGAASDTQPARADADVIVGTAADGSGAAHVLAVAADTGAERWRRTLPGQHIRRSLATAPDGAVLVGTQADGGGGLYRLPPGDHEPVALLSGAQFAAPGLAWSGGLVIGDRDGTLHVLDAAGAPRGRIPVGGPVFSAPVHDGDGILVAVSLKGVLSIDGLGVGWSFSIGQGVSFSGVAAARSGAAFVGSATGCAEGAAGGCVYAVEDGALRWAAGTDEAIQATPVVVGELVVVGSRAGGLTALFRADAPD